MGDRAWIGIGVTILICGASYSCTGPCSDDCPEEPYQQVVDAGIDRAVAQPQSGAPTCFDGDSILGLWEFTGPVAHQNRCTPQQIAAIANACFGVDGGDADAAIVDGGADVSTALDAGSPCATFTANNFDCAACINGAAYDGGSYSPSPVVIGVSADSAEQTINIAGCVASLSTANATCKQSYENLQLCADTACSVCPASDLQACLGYAKSPQTECTESETVDPTCNTLVTSVPQNDQQTECAAGSSDFATQLAIVASTMCGP